jgi:hypothetical protein
MRLAEQAWDKVMRETVANCWRKSSILTTADTVASANGKDMDLDSPESCVPRVSMNNTAGVPADSALQLVEAALAEVQGEFQEAGVLQKKNMIDIKDFIAMPEEKIVQKMRANEQDREENGGDGEEEVDTKPSRKEALQAAATLH